MINPKYECSDFEYFFSGLIQYYHNADKEKNFIYC
jgi:hypothetical protein